MSETALTTDAINIALKESEGGIHLVTQMVSTGKTAITIGVEIAKAVGLIDSQEAQLGRIEQSLKNLDSKLDTVIKMIDHLEERMDDQVITQLDQYIVEYEDKEAKLLSHIYNKMPSKMAALNTLYEQNNQAGIEKIMELMSQVPSDIVSPSVLCEKWEKICNEFSDNSNSKLRKYSESPLAIYDKKINETFNWDEEAYIYRKLYRLKIEALCARGAAICTMYECAKDGNMSMSDDNQTKLKEVKQYLTTHGADRKRQFDATGTAMKGKTFYSLVSNEYIDSCQEVESSKLTEIANTTVAFTNDNIVEMYNRALKLVDVTENGKERGRTIKEDMKVNGLITSLDLSDKVISNDFKYSHNKSSNQSGDHEQWLVRGQLINLKDSNPTFSEQCIYNKSKTEETVFLWITRKREEVLHNQGKILYWKKS